MNLKVASLLKINNFDILPFRILETVIREKVFKKYGKKVVRGAIDVKFL